MLRPSPNHGTQRLPNDDDEHRLRDFHHSLSLKCQFCVVPPTSVPIVYINTFINVWKHPTSRITDSKWYLQLPMLPSNIVVECNCGDKAVLRRNTTK